jgi:hypothetical protein
VTGNQRPSKEMMRRTKTPSSHHHQQILHFEEKFASKFIYLFFFI